MLEDIGAAVADDAREDFVVTVTFAGASEVIVRALTLPVHVTIVMFVGEEDCIMNE